MYPEGFATRIVPEGPATVGLEDAFRPHFFAGVATVVAKLLIQCEPDFALFGEKDYQQLKVVTRLARDLGLKTRIVGAPIVREPDGLALSSRNRYLIAGRARRGAGALSRAQGMRRRIAAGKPIDGRARRRPRGDYRAPALRSITSKRAMPRRWRRSPRRRPSRSGFWSRRGIGKTRLIDNVAV